MLVLASLVLGYPMIDALRKLDLVWLHPTPMKLCVRLLYAYPSIFVPHDAMLTMFVYATNWLSMHLYTLTYMSMHESCLLVCCPYFNTIKLWISNPNLHFSPMDTTFCLPFCLFVFFLICSFACLLSCFLTCLFILGFPMSPALCYSCHIYLTCLLCTLCTLSMHLFLFIAYLLVSCLFLCMYTYGERTHKAGAWSPKHKQKGRGCEHVDISQVAMFSSFRGLASPIWLCT